MTLVSDTGNSSITYILHLHLILASISQLGDCHKHGITSVNVFVSAGWLGTMLRVCFFYKIFLFLFLAKIGG